MFSWILLLIAIGALILVLFVGDENNQAVSWFRLGFFNVQPSEFVKVITIVFLANYYELNIKRLNGWGPSLFPIAICAVVAGLIFIQPDLGTTIIYCAIVGIIFLSVPISKEIKYKTVFATIGLIGFGIVALLGAGKGVLLERQMERFDFKNPCEKILSTGSQVCNCYIAINNGGLTGVGLGNSTQKYLYLPEPYTDFIFAIIVEELGIIVGIFIILMYMFILFRILMIGRRSPNNRGATMCYGIAIYIFLHIAINLMGIMGLIPLTGVPLPFMSYGGSFTICLVAALTIVQRVSVENGLLKERES
jgi:cell division protein FtsW